ncbi:hypothetical protein UlMin_010680 [Ulmus minor]
MEKTTSNIIKWSPWDFPLFIKPYSNFGSFINCITPIIDDAIQIPTKSLVQTGLQLLTQENVAEYSFSLKSVWESCIDKSSNGAAVSILLTNGETVVKYYSPTLSALQIHTKGVPSAPLMIGKESDSSDKGKNEEKLIPILRSNLSSSSTKITSDVGHEASSQTTDRFGHLYFQYNETDSPYERQPLYAKVKQLAEQYPGLEEFRSTDLTPYSWIAIAWYPIYQIPAANNESDLSACFVTYHNLSSFAGQRMKKGKSGSSTTGKEEKCEKIAIPPFGVATYKLNYEGLWVNKTTSDKEKITTYLKAVQDWLTELKFYHNDFNFFITRSFG